MPSINPTEDEFEAFKQSLAAEIKALNARIDSLETPAPLDVAKTLGVNYFDPRFRRKQGELARSPDPNFTRLWIDRIAALKMNLIRIPIYLESLYPYAQNSANVINQLKDLAAYCATKKIYFFVQLHQFANNDETDVGASTSPGGGGGFPSYIIQGFATAKAFYDRFWTNSLASIPDVWEELWLRFFKPILEVCNSNPYFVGLETMNEPALYDPSHWVGLGNYNTAIGQKIRNWGSDKYALFCNGFNRSGTAGSSPMLNKNAAPRVSKIIYAGHNYGGKVTAEFKQRFTEKIADFKQTQSMLGCPVIVGELSTGLKVTPLDVLTQDNWDHIFMELKNAKFGGTAWAYASGVGELHSMVNEDGTLRTPGNLYMNARQNVYGY